MGTRELEIFLVRYVDKPNGKFMNIAICMSEISDGPNRFLACKCTDGWEKLETLFPNADIALHKDWCEALQEDFCTPDKNRSVQERLEDCSSNIDVSTSRRSLNATDEPREEMRKLVRVHLR